MFLGRGIENDSEGVRFRTASTEPLSLDRCLVQSNFCNPALKPKTENRGTSAFKDNAEEVSVADQSVPLTIWA